tara:strand:+ start:6919 stop:7917 length:999 start_codon:yes stop_codon:yes gene_type:complete
MKYLVTGGAGFIGSHMIELLIANKHKVICVDDLSTGHKSNLSSVIQKIDFYQEKIELFDFSKIQDIDGIIHLAAQPSVQLSISNFANSSISNLSGTIKIIDYCRLYNVPLVYASSSAVYGNLEFGNDEIESFDLLSPYAADKYLMEQYSKMANKIYQLSSVGLRFFNVYGPRQDPKSPYSGVISVFTDKLLKEKNITINGGYQTRDFIYVKNVVNIIYSAVNLASKNSICEVSNVLTGESITIDELAKKMIKIIDAKVEVKYQNLPLGDPEKSNGSSKKMTRLFNVKPDKFVKIDNGLFLTVESILGNNKSLNFFSNETNFYANKDNDQYGH